MISARCFAVASAPTPVAPLVTAPAGSTIPTFDPGYPASRSAARICAAATRARLAPGAVLDILGLRDPDPSPLSSSSSPRTLAIDREVGARTSQG